MGPEELILLKNLKLAELFVEAEYILTIQDLWHKLFAVNCRLSVWPEQLHMLRILKGWPRKKFMDVYPSKHVTPHMHTMMNHVSEFMKLHSSILPLHTMGHGEICDRI